MGPEGCLPFVSGCNPNEMVGVRRLILGIDSYFLGASKRLEMSGSGYRSFREIRLSPSEVNAKSKRASFFWMKELEPHGGVRGMMNPVARFSSMNLCRAASSSWDKE